MIMLLFCASVIAYSNKLDPYLNREQYNQWAIKDNKLRVYVQMSDIATREEFLSYIDSKGYAHSSILYGIAYVEVPINELNFFVGSNKIRYIEQIEPPIVDKLDKVRTTVNFLPGFFGLFGQGVKIGQWEIGILDITHPDFITNITIVDNAIVTDHATHVAGILIGNGTFSDGLYTGFAPHLRLYAFDTNSSGYDSLFYEVANATSIFNLSFSHNSWGFNLTSSICDELGRYPIMNFLYDSLIRASETTKPITVIFAVGNERELDVCGINNSEINQYNTSLGPAIAKNVISVGAVDSLVSSMTDFSSWGPTDDGRIKPDVVAPGCFGAHGIVSTFPNSTYGEFCGTSQAAPVVTGIAALMFEQYRLNYSRDPLPSTIKGILIHTAMDLEISGNTGDPATDGPDYKHGYGLVNAKEAIEQVRNKGLIESSVSITGENKTYYTRLDTGNDILKITLVWDDLPGDPSSSGKQLKNDLDLIVYDNNSVRVFPWTLDPNNPSFVATQNKEDHLNNVEQVFKGNNSVGVWTIIVNATNLTSAQNFSLIIDNFYDPNSPSSPTVWASPKKAGKNISIFWLESKDQETGIAEYQYQLDNTTNASYISVGQSLRFSITNTTQGKHTVFVRALDYFGNPSVPGNTTFVFDSVAPTQANISANFVTPVGATINVDTTENATAHVEYGTSVSYGSIVGAEEFRQHQSVALTGLSVNTLYHYRVKSTDEAGNNISSADNTFTTTNSSNIVNSFSGSLAPYVQASPFVNVTLNRPGQWDLSWDISGQNATLNVYDPQGGLFASKTAAP